MTVYITADPLPFALLVHRSWHEAIEVRPFVHFVFPYNANSSPPAPTDPNSTLPYSSASSCRDNTYFQRAPCGGHARQRTRSRQLRLQGDERSAAEHEQQPRSCYGQRGQLRIEMPSLD